MIYKIEFDIASITFLIILLTNCIFQKRFSTRSSKVCIFLIVDILFTTILNLTTSFTLTYIPNYIVLNTVLGLTQAILTNFCPILFYIFIHATTHQFRRINPRFWRFTCFFLIIETLLILSTPLTHFLFTYNSTVEYTHNYGYYILYIFSFVFMVASIQDIAKNRKSINSGKIISVLIFCAGTIIAVGTQMFIPELQLTGFACTIAVFAAYISLQNPGFFFDHSTGTLNKMAFIETVASLNEKSTGSIIIFKMTKTNKIKDLFGIEGRYYITRQFMQLLQTTFPTSKIFYLFNDTYILLFDSKNFAEEAGIKINEITKKSLKLFPVEGSDTIINYRITGRLHVVNDLQMLLHNSDGSTYTTNETISLINFIATSYQPHHIAIVDEKLVYDFQEQIRIKHVVENAIEHESFEVFMQPIYSLKDNAFTGAEALLRLKDTNGSYIPPLSFIPEAEANGDIILISDIMIQKTCDFINETQLFDKGIQTVNVNLSMIQCMYEGIIDHICDILEKNHISPTLIRFEITESVAVNDEVRFTKLLEEMTERGIEYALDDYGTGYSNTSKILNHSFSEIKFDKSIIDSMNENNRNQNALKYLFDLTKEKKMISLAEGVENKETVEMLKKVGCDLIQGFYFSHPMPAAEFKKFLEEHN
ncbi:MAG: EAL domain-containing protein [Treponema sp.]|nr:EAL domain-containing protein [Treponema sp.]